ncbi:hypothetical protein D9757_006416 [Collybiopsis confluens]|uniref:Uncharacterized protein n=1 Tax=Collybiopsis confluens TaxID=2823264 RepID=A0A8H5HJ73_9AGAR|nr:hypothetical protein D9757_006416 [Collybiopsis confluens]
MSHIQQPYNGQIGEGYGGPSGSAYNNQLPPCDIWDMGTAEFSYGYEAATYGANHHDISLLELSTLWVDFADQSLFPPAEAAETGNAYMAVESTSMLPAGPEAASEQSVWSILDELELTLPFRELLCIDYPMTNDFVTNTPDDYKSSSGQPEVDPVTEYCCSDIPQVPVGIDAFNMDFDVSAASASAPTIIENKQKLVEETLCGLFPKCSIYKLRVWYRRIRPMEHQQSYHFQSQLHVVNDDQLPLHDNMAISLDTIKGSGHKDEISEAQLWKDIVQRLIQVGALFDNGGQSPETTETGSTCTPMQSPASARLMTAETAAGSSDCEHFEVQDMNVESSAKLQQEAFHVDYHAANNFVATIPNDDIPSTGRKGPANECCGCWDVPQSSAVAVGVGALHMDVDSSVPSNPTLSLATQSVPLEWTECLIIEAATMMTPSYADGTGAV